MRPVTITVLLAFVACGKGEPSADPAMKAEPAKATGAAEPAKPEGAVDAPTVELAGADTPEKALAMAIPALRNADADALWALTPADARAQLDSLLAKAKSGEAALPDVFGLAGKDVSNLTARDLHESAVRMNAEKIKAEYANEPIDPSFEKKGEDVLAHFNLGASHCELLLVKEDDGWKMANLSCEGGG